jgi:hypothetical protein
MHRQSITTLQEKYLNKFMILHGNFDKYISNYQLSTETLIVLRGF